MPEPTIEERLRRRFIVMSADSEMCAELRAQVPEDWEMVTVTDLDEVGEWNDILLHRFIVLDLDEVEAFDPLDVIGQLRMEYQINTPVLCFGGDADLQEEMRLARADRFFTREEMVQRLPQFLAQYDWGDEG